MQIPEALVETDWLADHLGTDGMAIIEVDEDTERLHPGAHTGGDLAQLEDRVGGHAAA